MPTQVDLIKKYQLKIAGHLGQHLLIDPNVQRKIVDLLDLGPGDRVLEIGPGLGALTGEMLRLGVRVWAVEKEKNFIPILKAELGDYPKERFHLLEGDILEVEVEEILRQMIASHPVKIIGNLPYYITAPILFKIFDVRKYISKAVLTVQKEVAQRMVANPGTKDYSRLSLAVRYFSDTRLAFSINPTCFTPRPEVDSAVVVMNLHSRKQFTNEDFLFYVIEAAFKQRRKTLLHCLRSDPRLGASEDKLEAVFKDRGWSQTVRGEELLLKDFFYLAEALLPHVDKPGAAC